MGENGIFVHNGCGRLGKQSTRAQNRRISDELESLGFKRVGGGGYNKGSSKYLKEEYMKPLSGKGRKGSNYVDITFEMKNGKKIRVNTVDVDRHGKITQREMNAAASINNKKAPNDPTIILIPKGQGIGNLYDELRKRGII